MFYLGTHQPGWLGRTDVPLFLSFQRLRDRRTLKPATGPWSLDSGGFTELNAHGTWTISPEEYVETTRILADQAGMPDFAAAQDWMCEPTVLAKTGLSILEHQKRTLASYELLLKIAPDMPWCPVLQGWRKEDYLSHVEMYRSSGIDLATLPVVGIGSICRRQATREAVDIITTISRLGIKLHGFGLKQQGLREAAHDLHTADSMAWSFGARRNHIRLPGCPHANCANCIKYALLWRGDLLSRLDETYTRQLLLHFSELEAA